MKIPSPQDHASRVNQSPVEGVERYRHLTDRALIRLSGEGVRDFLQRLVTNDVSGPLPVWAGLLTPQGKALFPVTVVPANVFSEWWKVFNALAPDVRGKRVDRLTVRISVTGKLTDGTVVSSGSVDYPMQVCWGCLMVVPIDPTAETPADSAKACVATAVPSDYIVSCVPGQDEFQPCQAYCQFCRTRELAGTKSNAQGACDPRFCPALSEEDMVKFKLK